MRMQKIITFFFFFFYICCVCVRVCMYVHVCASSCFALWLVRVIYDISSCCAGVRGVRVVLPSDQRKKERWGRQPVSKPLDGLVTPNDEPVNKEQPMSTDHILRHRFKMPENFRFPLVARDPALERPKQSDVSFRLPREDTFPATPEEFGGDLRSYLNYRDVWTRRKAVNIPYFGVGSIIAVTASDPNQPKGSLRFIGTCLRIRLCGMNSAIKVANVIQGMPICKHYDLFGPYISKIEVLDFMESEEEDLLYMFKEKKNPEKYIHRYIVAL